MSGVVAKVSALLKLPKEQNGRTAFAGVQNQTLVKSDLERIGRDVDDWYYLMKYDGERRLMYLNGGKVHLISRRNEVVDGGISSRLGCPGGIKDLILDGEMMKMPSGGVKIKVFDVLFNNGVDVRHWPFLKRMEHLENLSESYKLNGQKWYMVGDVFRMCELWKHVNNRGLKPQFTRSGNTFRLDGVVPMKGSGKYPTKLSRNGMTTPECLKYKNVSENTIDLDVRIGREVDLIGGKVFKADMYQAGNKLFAETYLTAHDVAKMREKKKSSGNNIFEMEYTVDSHTVIPHWAESEPPKAAKSDILKGFQLGKGSGELDKNRPKTIGLKVDRGKLVTSDGKVMWTGSMNTKKKFVACTILPKRFFPIRYRGDEKTHPNGKSAVDSAWEALKNPVYPKQLIAKCKRSERWSAPLKKKTPITLKKRAHSLKSVRLRSSLSGKAKASPKRGGSGRGRGSPSGRRPSPVQQGTPEHLGKMKLNEMLEKYSKAIQKKDQFKDVNYKSAKDISVELEYKLRRRDYKKGGVKKDTFDKIKGILKNQNYRMSTQRVEDAIYKIGEDRIFRTSSIKSLSGGRTIKTEHIIKHTAEKDKFVKSPISKHEFKVSLKYEVGFESAQAVRHLIGGQKPKKRNKQRTTFKLEGMQVDMTEVGSSSDKTYEIEIEFDDSKAGARAAMKNEFYMLVELMGGAPRAPQRAPSPPKPPPRARTPTPPPRARTPTPPPKAPKVPKKKKSPLRHGDYKVGDPVRIGEPDYWIQKALNDGAREIRDIASNRCHLPDGVASRAVTYWQFLFNMNRDKIVRRSGQHKGQSLTTIHWTCIYLAMLDEGHPRKETEFYNSFIGEGTCGGKAMTVGQFQYRLKDTKEKLDAGGVRKNRVPTFRNMNYYVGTLVNNIEGADNREKLRQYADRYQSLVNKIDPLMKDNNLLKLGCSKPVLLCIYVHLQHDIPLGKCLKALRISHTVASLAKCIKRVKEPDISQLLSFGKPKKEPGAKKAKQNPCQCQCNKDLKVTKNNRYYYENKNGNKTYCVMKGGPLSDKCKKTTCPDKKPSGSPKMATSPKGSPGKKPIAPGKRPVASHGSPSGVRRSGSGNLESTSKFVYKPKGTTISTITVSAKRVVADKPLKGPGVSAILTQEDLNKMTKTEHIKYQILEMCTKHLSVSKQRENLEDLRKLVNAGSRAAGVSNNSPIRRILDRGLNLWKKEGGTYKGLVDHLGVFAVIDLKALFDHFQFVRPPGSNFGKVTSPKSGKECGTFLEVKYRGATKRMLQKPGSTELKMAVDKRKKSVERRRQQIVKGKAEWKKRMGKVHKQLKGKKVPKTPPTKAKAPPKKKKTPPVKKSRKKERAIEKFKDFQNTMEIKMMVMGKVVNAKVFATGTYTLTGLKNEGMVNTFVKCLMSKINSTDGAVTGSPFARALQIPNFRLGREFHEHKNSLISSSKETNINLALKKVVDKTGRDPHGFGGLKSHIEHECGPGGRHRGKLPTRSELSGGAAIIVPEVHGNYRALQAKFKVVADNYLSIQIQSTGGVTLSAKTGVELEKGWVLVLDLMGSFFRAKMNSR